MLTETPLNITVIENNDELRETLVDALDRIGHNALGVPSGAALPVPAPADILILDLDLFGEDGLDVLRQLRSADRELGILVMTSNIRVEDRVAAYQNGADLFLSKPPSLKELGAAINSIARRLSPSDKPSLAMSLNLLGLQLTGPRATVNVLRCESDWLCAFAQASGQLLDNTTLSAIAAKPGDEISKAALEVRIVRLRKKLEQCGAAGPTIKSVRGFGYQLCVPVVVNTSFTSPQPVSLLSSQDCHENQVHLNNRTSLCAPGSKS